MNKILLKSYIDVVRLKNVERSLMMHHNTTLDLKRSAKRNGDADGLARYTHELQRTTEDMAHIKRRIADAEETFDADSQQLALLRTLMYCAATVADNMAFNLVCWMKKYAADADGEARFAGRIRENCRALGEINREFGEMGSRANENFNICEDVLVEEVTRFCEALYKEMAGQEVTDDKEVLRKRLSEKFKVKGGKR